MLEICRVFKVLLTAIICIINLPCSLIVMKKEHIRYVALYSFS